MVQGEEGRPRCLRVCMVAFFMTHGASGSDTWDTRVHVHDNVCVQVVKCVYDAEGKPGLRQQVWKAVPACRTEGTADYVLQPWLGYDPVV